jgi:elongation factor Ts
MSRGKIVEGRVAKIFKERALLEQPFIKDTGKTVAEHIKAQVAAIGENIQVRLCIASPERDHAAAPTVSLVSPAGL